MNKAENGEFQWDISKEIFDTPEEAKQAVLDGKVTFSFKGRKYASPIGESCSKKSVKSSARKPAKKTIKAAESTSEDAYYVVLDPAGFIRSTYSGVLSKKGESQLRQAGKVKKFTDYDKFCEFIENNYAERRANTKMQENVSSSTKKTIKASKLAKVMTKRRAIKAGINEPSTEGPLCVCENCKAEIESREGRQTVYNVISDLDIEPDETLVCDWCESEAPELYQISPDEVESAKKAVKCSSPIWPDSKYSSQDIYEVTSPDGDVEESFDTYEQAEDYAKSIIKDTGVDHYDIYHVVLRYDSDADEWVDSETDELVGTINASTAVKCSWADEDWDSLPDDSMGGAEPRFYVSLYFDTKFRDLEDSETYFDFDKAVDRAHEWLGQGPVKIRDAETGAEVRIDPDEYWDNFDGEFWCTPELAEFRDEVWRSMGIDASTTDDELEPVMGDDFAEDMGYGFDSNGEALSESYVEELERIAREILESSDIANIDEYADLHNFNYYASIPWVQESFDITFTYSADVYELSKLGLISETARMLTTAAPYDIHINVRCKNGEVERVDVNDITVNNGYVQDAELSNFNIEALEQYIGGIVAPVAMDIYNGTTNI